MTAESLGRNDLQVLLDEISQELAAGGIRGDLFIVGGAAEVLAITERVMGGRPLLPKSQYIVEELFPPTSETP